MSDYFKIEALSYSALRNLSISPAYFKHQKEQESEEKEHFIIGSGVDILLTEADKFWDYFALEFQETCDKIPTGQMKEFTETLFKYKKELGDTEESEQKAYKSIGFKRKNDTLNNIIERYVEECLEYDNWLEAEYNHRLNNKNKQILSKSQYKLITDIAQSLNSNKFTKKYFENSTGKNMEVHNQLEIFWEFKSEKCKSKLDKVIVNHDNKTIQPIDLKTTGVGVYNFNTSCFKYRYDIKSYLYK